MADDDPVRRGRRDPSDPPHPIDIHVGRRLRERRTQRALSQEQLADMVGVTFQQIQKYEKAANRISASKLWEFARALGVSVDFFYEGMGSGLHEEMAVYSAEALSVREHADMARAHALITDGKVRRKLMELARAIGASQVARGE